MTKSSTISLAVSLLFISFFNFSLRLSNSTLSDVVACFFTSSTEHLADTSFSICVNWSLIGFSSFSNLSWSLVSIVENEHLILLFIMSLISLGVIPWVPEPCYLQKGFRLGKWNFQGWIYRLKHVLGKVFWSNHLHSFSL